MNDAQNGTNIAHFDTSNIVEYNGNDGLNTPYFTPPISPPSSGEIVQKWQIYNTDDPINVSGTYLFPGSSVPETTPGVAQFFYLVYPNWGTQAPCFLEGSKILCLIKF